MGNKRANTNGQQRREDFEYEDAREREGGPPTQEDPGEGFTKASAETLKKVSLIRAGTSFSSTPGYYNKSTN